MARILKLGINSFFDIWNFNIEPRPNYYPKKKLIHHMTEQDITQLGSMGSEVESGPFHSTLLLSFSVYLPFG
jgi:hypothetical protein